MPRHVIRVVVAVVAGAARVPEPGMRRRQEHRETLALTKEI